MTFGLNIQVVDLIQKKVLIITVFHDILDVKFPRSRMIFY